MTNVLVTGGAGYIGSHTSKALAQAGFRPVVLDNLSSGHRWAVQWGPLVEGNVNDEALVRRLIDHHKIEAVIHFAANAYVGESMRTPEKYFRNNVSNTLNLLQAVLDTGVKKVVFSSTCATYGMPLRLPISEDHPQSPLSPYGESKLFVEKILKWYGQAHNLKSVCLRYFNAAGADPDGEIGEDHTPETHIIPLVIQAALASSREVSVFGTDYDTPDGTAIRDYIHVTDLADAHVRAVRQLLNGCASTTLNIGTGQGHSVREILSSVQKISGRKIRFREEPRRAGDAPILVAYANAAYHQLGWEPQFADLDAIVDTAWQWHRGHGAVSAAG